MSARQTIEHFAAEWLARKADPEWSDEDDRSLDAWLGESMAHAAAYWRLEQGCEALDRLNPRTTALLTGGLAEDLRADDEYYEGTAEPIRRRWSVSRLAALAAALVGVLISTVVGISALRQHPAPQSQIYSTQFGQVAKLQLQDGTRVSLDTDSRVRVTHTGRRRTMWLDRGRVYLEVARDEHRPFTVLAGNGEVVVVGTKFVVSRQGAEAQVAVIEGRVRLEPASRGNPGAGHLELTAGDVGRTSANTLILTSIDVAHLRSRLAWQTGMVVFDETPLAEAIAEFNRYNERKLRVLGADAGHIAIGGSFKLGNVEGFARLLRRAYGLRVEIVVDETTTG